jgi:hypothetical protein
MDYATAAWNTVVGPVVDGFTQAKAGQYVDALNTLEKGYSAPEFEKFDNTNNHFAVGIKNILIAIWNAFVLVAIIMFFVSWARLGSKTFWTGAQASVMSAPTVAAAVVKKPFQDDFTGLPYSTLPNGIPMTGSGDAMANSSASFYGDDAMVQTGFFGQESAAQDLYGHFDDEQRFIGSDDPAVNFGDDPAVAFADEEKFFDGGITPTAADSQLTYGTFLDDSQYQTFADTIVASASMKNKKQAKPGKVPPSVVKSDKLPGRWGSCANRKKFVPKKNSDEYLARNWSGRLL